MSFSFQAAGRIEDTKRQVKAVKSYGDNPQLEAARNLILAELDAWPQTERRTAGALVEVNGHADNYNRTLTITIRPLYLAE